MKYLLPLIFISCASNMIVVDSSKIRKSPGHGAAIKTKKSFSLVEIKDTRDVKNNIGIVKTGYKNESTPLVLDRSIPEFLTHFVKKELPHRGFTMDDRTKANYHMKVYVQKLSLTEIHHKMGDEQMNCQARIAFDMYPKGQSYAKWHGIITVDVTSKGSVDATSLALPTFNQCMDEAITKLTKQEKFLELFE